MLLRSSGRACLQSEYEGPQHVFQIDTALILGSPKEGPLIVGTPVCENCHACNLLSNFRPPSNLHEILRSFLFNRQSWSKFPMGGLCSCNIQISLSAAVLWGKPKQPCKAQGLAWMVQDLAPRANLFTRSLGDADVRGLKNSLGHLRCATCVCSSYKTWAHKARLH